jgi:16S rRNA (cytosine967-C5)-methyltransferase
VQVADLVRAAPGARVLDACAAPGGKAFRLASAGAEVFAVDRSAERLALARESAARLGLGITFATHDWEAGPMRGGAAYDAVLVDAPCTALGTLRRHPEVKWRRQLVDVLTQPTRQRVILEAAAAHVAAGGALVYAVCSPEPEEGPAVARAFAAAHPEFTLAEELSTAPPTEGEDAFYAARLVRA